ncbi:aminopeptidase M1 [Tanacetum coccineum]|uniref:Aminopeptidase M1 n=1 Tax=Tanacetum coccineum TaxID=301880 RepID=A0ABQ5F0A0_9ASTR
MLVAIWPYIKHQNVINDGLHSFAVFATISPSSILCKNAIICCFEGPISSYEKVKEVEEFFASRAKPLIARTLKQSIERVEINAKWVETCRNEKKMV